MIYKEFQGKQLSALGMGCMRLPMRDGEIDTQATADMVAYAVQQGVNYFDTAWGYHDGKSEPVMGEILRQYPRDSYYVATKFPGYDPSLWGSVTEIFEKQLERLQTDYIDFYLFHNLCEKNADAYLDPKYGIYDYLIEQKRNGRIRHLGFSAHGEIPVMKRFLEAYGKDMEFCQIELNYYDWTFQDARGKVELLKEWNIPVWVMEPVRGGQLAKLPEDAEAKLKAARPDESIPAWAFRFLQGIPEVTMTLSGMSSIQQMKENIATYEEANLLSEEETALILGIADDMIRRTAVPCTACRYCVSKCPQGLEIPNLLKLYNEGAAEGPGGFIVPMRLGAMPAEKRPNACIKCHSCEVVCPQGIAIPDYLEKLAKGEFK